MRKGLGPAMLEGDKCNGEKESSAGGQRENIRAGWDGGRFTVMVQEGIKERMTLKEDPLEGGGGVNRVDIWEQEQRL